MSTLSAQYWYNLASSERGFGRLAEAEAACDRAIALDDSQYASYLLRSELRVQTSDANHIETLKRKLARPRLEDRAKFFLGYALAKELDDLRRFDEAFHWFSEAASARRRNLKYDVSTDETKLERAASVFSRDIVTHRGTECVSGAASSPCLSGFGSSRYIFIVGLPRSGTTLLERILAGIPGTFSSGETDNFSRALLSASPPPGSQFSDVFSRAAAADSATVAEDYSRRAMFGVYLKLATADLRAVGLEIPSEVLP